MTETAKTIDPEIIAQREAKDREHYQVAYDFIKANALTRTSFKEAAKLVHMSPFQFHRNFHRLFKITPKKLATQVRIEAVKKKLLEGIPFETIAAYCGFAHQSHMTATFKKAVGQPPSRWLRSEKIRLAGESNE